MAGTAEAVNDTDSMLAAYDEQMRGAPPHPPADVRVEHDGPLVRVVGQLRGFVEGPREVGARGAELDRLIALADPSSNRGPGRCQFLKPIPQ